LSINEISLNSNARERWYSNTDCSRLPSAGGRLRSSSTHSRRRRRRRLSWGGDGGGGAKVPHRRGGAYGPGRVIRSYTRDNARIAFAAARRSCGILWILRSKYPPKRLFSFVRLAFRSVRTVSIRCFVSFRSFLYVHFSLFSVFLGYASSVLLSGNRKPIGNCLSPHTVRYNIQRRAGENQNYYFSSPVLQWSRVG